MTTLVAYSITATAGIVALWSLPLKWIANLNAADTYRANWTADRDQHCDDIKASMGARWSA